MSVPKDPSRSRLAFSDLLLLGVGGKQSHVGPDLREGGQTRPLGGWSVKGSVGVF